MHFSYYILVFRWFILPHFGYVSYYVISDKFQICIWNYTIFLPFPTMVFYHFWLFKTFLLMIFQASHFAPPTSHFAPLWIFYQICQICHFFMSFTNHWAFFIVFYHFKLLKTFLLKIFQVSHFAPPASHFAPLWIFFQICQICHFSCLLLLIGHSSLFFIILSRFYPFIRP